MKFEEQIMMNRERDFISELKKDDIYIDDEMLQALHKNNMINEDEKAAYDRKNMFQEQSRILQKLGLNSTSKNFKQYDDTPFPHSIYQTQLDYENAMIEMGLMHKENIKKRQKCMKSIKVGELSPQKVLEKKIDKYLELSKKIQNLPIDKLKEMKFKLNQISSTSKNLSKIEL